MPQQEQENDSLFNPDATIKGAAIIACILGAGFRDIFYAIGSPGKWAVDKYHLISTCFVMPVFVIATGPPLNEDGEVLLTLACTAAVTMTVLQGLAARLNGRERHAQEIGRPLGGQAGEFFLPVMAGLLALPICPGLTWWICAGFVANQIQLQMIRAKFERMTQHALNAQEEAGLFQEFLRQRMGE